ncbi:MAG TPA: hypothetical protein VFQ60_01715 [Patescibacteria group bacterium]|nr:hypothetical protein [Patescibacteria group bacterium]
MSKEFPDSKEKFPVRMEIEPGFEEYIPQSFKDDPIGYFDREGKNVKPGLTSFKPSGEIKEDPTAVKDFPEWKNPRGKALQIVAKRVNVKKSQVAKSGDPFYEFSVMKRVRSLGLPAPEPIGKVGIGTAHILLMEASTWIKNFGRYWRPAA